MKRAALALIVLLGWSLSVAAQNRTLFIPGQIAYVGRDFNVYTVTGGTHTALTDDAGITGTSIRYYRYPTWATDGRLAYVASETAYGGERRHSTIVFVSHDVETPARLVYATETESFIYAYWAPRGCGDGCYDLAALFGDYATNDVVLKLIRDDGSTASVIPVGRADSLYFTWSPNGRQLAWQRDGAAVEVYDVSAHSISNIIPVVPGGFFAPGWSPIDDRLLISIESQPGTDLVVTANGTVTPLVTGLDGFVRFAWSPDGNQIAYKVAGRPLTIIDAVTSEVIARSHTTDVYAFFWAPNSRAVAYVSPPDQPEAFNAKPSGQQESTTPDLSWSVLDVAAQTVRRYGTFRPTAEQIYLFTYFDQFAQSHRIWSPDSRQIVYSEIDAQGQPQIMLLDTQSNVVPLSIAQGYFAVWSFE